jgi:hypothetical protein
MAPKSAPALVTANFQTNFMAVALSPRKIPDVTNVCIHYILLVTFTDAVRTSQKTLRCY